MSKEFVINKIKIKQLAKEFNIGEKICFELFKSYKEDVSDKIKTQYLAHIIRSMELKMREITKNDLFVIKCEPIENSIIKEAVGKYHKNHCFIIYFNSNLGPVKQRIVLAHELGHLFWVAIANIFDKNVNEEHEMEPLASLFGVFTIAAKNDFYQNYQNEAIEYAKNTSWNGLINDFLKLEKGFQ